MNGYISETPYQTTTENSHVHCNTACEGDADCHVAGFENSAKDCFFWTTDPASPWYTAINTMPVEGNSWKIFGKQCVAAQPIQCDIYVVQPDYITTTIYPNTAEVPVLAHSVDGTVLVGAHWVYGTHTAAQMASLAVEYPRDPICS